MFERMVAMKTTKTFQDKTPYQSYAEARSVILPAITMRFDVNARKLMSCELVSMKLCVAANHGSHYYQSDWHCWSVS